MNIVYNPTNEKGVILSHLLDECQNLTSWAEQGEANGLDFKETYEKCYPFGVFEMAGGVIDMADRGKYLYPEDPALVPIVEMHNSKGEFCFIYSYGIIGIVKADGSQFITRLD